MSVHALRLDNLDRIIEVPDNANLREACLRTHAKLYYGLGPWLNCGGRARCGRCRVTVLAGGESLSDPTPLERDRFGGEVPIGVRLACQANVRGPVTVDTRGRARER